MVKFWFSSTLELGAKDESSQMYLPSLLAYFLVMLKGSSMNMLIRSPQRTCEFSSTLLTRESTVRKEFRSRVRKRWAMARERSSHLTGRE
jgi:hypothetical protein